MSARPSAGSTARRIAVQRLIRLEERAAYVGFLAGAETEADATPRDERQAREYVSGVTRWRRWLDFVLSHFTRGELGALEPPLRQILRVALYELLIQQTPPHAAVNEAVALTTRMVRPQAARLTNGVLRNVVRAMGALPVPEHEDPAERLAIEYSHPTWMVRRWLARFGEEDVRRLLQANNVRPVFGLRVNTRQVTMEAVTETLTAAEVDWERSDYIDYFLRIRQLQAVVSEGLLAQGAVAVQDEAAGLVVRAMDPQPGERILDLCSAPGGKALHAVQLMEDSGELLAVDVHEGRLGLVAESAREQGATIVRTRAADGRTLQPDDVGLFDRVLLDAPCSGTGVLARRADLRWNRQAKDLVDLIRLQDELLDAAARLVRPGGLLVYGTCTIESEENEERIGAFLERHSAFVLERSPSHIPPSAVDDDGFVRTLPHIHGIDGAFAARLRRDA